MAHFILIFGPPASGKTRFIEQLSTELEVELPIFSKDIMKEIIFETIGVGDTELSQKQGAAAWDILMMSMEELAKGDGMYIFEGNFRERHRQLFQKLENEWGATFDQVLLTSSAEQILKRYQDRYISGERHPGHADSSREMTIQDIEKAIDEEAVFADVVGRRATIDTSDLSTLDYAPGIELIKTRLGYND
jgi:predicted kinase